MKNTLLLLIFLLHLTPVFPQDEMVKEGWNFAAFPAVSFDTDLGFQYGGVINIYNYGDGSRYPRYDHSFYLEVSRFTKGSGNNRFYYDSDRLIKGIHTSVDLSFLTDQAYDFYGFNGYDAVVNGTWTDDTQPDYVSRMFYKYQRKMFRFKVDFEGNLIGGHLGWTAGFNLLNFRIASVDLNRLNKGKDEDKLLPEVDGLYEKYRDWGILPDNEVDGGFVPVLKAGLVYDTRDNRPNPMKGIWTEAVIVGATKLLGAESAFSKFSLTHRQYFTIIQEDLSLAYRIAYQTTIGGHAPFYYQNQVITSVMTGAKSEGLGGAKTLRGVRRNRVVGDGFFYGNVEARWKFARFKFLRNNFYLGLNGFLDIGQVTKRIDGFGKINPDTGTDLPDDYYDEGAEELHLSFGGGLRVAMNQNFIIALDYGIATDKRDGDSGIYIGMNYLF